MLRLSLGSANVSMPYRERFAYKNEYENFKMQFTVVQLVMGLVSLWFLDYPFVNCTLFSHPSPTMS